MGRPKSHPLARKMTYNVATAYKWKNCAGAAAGNFDQHLVTDLAFCEDPGRPLANPLNLRALLLLPAAASSSPRAHKSPSKRFRKTTTGPARVPPPCQPLFSLWLSQISQPGGGGGTAYECYLQLRPHIHGKKLLRTHTQCTIHCMPWRMYSYVLQ